MPSTTSSWVSRVFDSSTVMTPSLPTFFMASAMILPMVSSLLAELVPTWAIMSRVAGVEKSSSLPFPHHLRAHVLERVLQFDFFGYGDAVLGDGRRTELLLNHNVAAPGAECDFYRVRQEVDAAENRLARLLAMNNLLCHC